MEGMLDDGADVKKLNSVDVCGAHGNARLFNILNGIEAVVVGSRFDDGRIELPRRVQVVVVCM